MNDDDQIQCQKCFDNKDISETHTLQCSHVFCLQCLNEYIKYHLDQSRCNIPCPDRRCEIGLLEPDIRKILSDIDFDRYNRLMIHLVIPDLVECFLKGCNNAMTANNELDHFICTKCFLYCCLNCKKSHPDHSCDEFRRLSSDKQMQTDARQKNIANQNLQKKLEQDRIRRKKEEEKQDYVKNSEIFECLLCCRVIGRDNGVQLKGCEHKFCKNDLKTFIMKTTKYPLLCPDATCDNKLKDSEIRAMLNEEEYMMYTKREFNHLKPKLKKYFHCKKDNCEYFCELSPTLTTRVAVKYFNYPYQFKCRVCKSVNCISCEAIHDKMSCVEYQRRVKTEKEEIGKLIESRDLMQCPDCRVYLMKNRGCNWIECSNCGQELCWITQKRRWGPDGPGDTSDGCRCGVGDVPCHPDCSGCMPHDGLIL